MMKYKILFAGLGSIGKRHLKNVFHFLKERGDSFIIDAVRSGITEKNDNLIENMINKSYSCNDNIYENYDILFVTNPTSLHFDTIKKYVGTAQHMFIEKPVFEGSDYNIDVLGLLKGNVYYVACPLRYTSVLQYVKNNIDCDKTIAVRSICSSYLPDWRQEQDYRSTYSAHKNMGGGAAIDLIHEWDYLSWLFGMPETVYSIVGKYSDLEIDSEDIAIYIAKNNSMTYELHLDYFGRSVVRELQIFMPDETICADIANGRISFLNSKKIINLHEERDCYQMREIKHFFDIIEGRSVNDNDLSDAIKVLRIAEGRKK